MMAPFPETRCIGDVAILVERRKRALQRIYRAVRYAESSVIGFCNAHTVTIARQDADFRNALKQMTLFNDGSGVNIGSRLLYGKTFPDNLNGTDLTPDLLAMLPAGTSVFLLGGKPGVAAKAAKKVRAGFPNIAIAGVRDGFFSSAEEPMVLEEIRACKPDIVLVGMGHPRQEMWATRNGPHIGVPTLCVGALIDRFAGLVPRAPLFMRKRGLEWVFRLFLEPRRLSKRYIVGNILFFGIILRQHYSMLRQSRDQGVFS